MISLSAGDFQSFPLKDTVTGEEPIRKSVVELRREESFLYIRVICDDDHIVSRFTERDDPLFEEEAVEVFLSAGSDDPHHYFEFEVSPHGVLWDGIITSPNLNRVDMVSDPRWDSHAVQWGAAIHYDQGKWEGWLGLDLVELTDYAKLNFGLRTDDEVSGDWRINVYRIDRGPDGIDEFTALNPTLKDPADFHVPQQMLHLQLVD